MSTLDPAGFAAIEARANAASAGPWLAKGMYPQEVLGNDDGLTLVATTHSSPDGPPFNTEFIAHAREDIPALLAAVRERDDTIARVREVGLLGLDEIAQKSIDATVARMQDQLGCTPDDLGPDVMAKIVDSHIEQAELFAGPVLDALRAALDPQETP